MASHAGPAPTVRPAERGTTLALFFASGFAVDSDARPVIESGAPVTHRGKRSGNARAFRYRELLDIQDAVFQASPPEGDPVLAAAPLPLRSLPRAGLELERGRTLQRLGEAAAAQQAFRRSQRLLRRATTAEEAAGARP